MANYVFDTEPLIAYLYDEPGADVVRDLLADVRDGSEGTIAEVTASEVFYLLARIEGVDGEPTEESLRLADRDVRSFVHAGLDVERADWRAVGEIKAHPPIPLGDAHAVALATDRDATLVVAGDADIEQLPVDVELRRIRRGSA